MRQEGNLQPQPQARHCYIPDLLQDMGHVLSQLPQQLAGMGSCAGLHTLAQGMSPGRASDKRQGRRMIPRPSLEPPLLPLPLTWAGVLQVQLSCGTAAKGLLCQKWVQAAPQTDKQLHRQTNSTSLQGQPQNVPARPPCSPENTHWFALYSTQGKAVTPQKTIKIKEENKSHPCFSSSPLAVLSGKGHLG